MTFTHTVTGATDRSTIVVGDVALVSGTWRSSGLFSGTVVTGGGTVLAYGVNIGSALMVGTVQVGSAMILTNKNKGGDGNTNYGSIQLTEIDSSNEMSGDWWAIVRV